MNQGKLWYRMVMQIGRITYQENTTTTEGVIHHQVWHPLGLFQAWGSVAVSPPLYFIFYLFSGFISLVEMLSSSLVCMWKYLSFSWLSMYPLVWVPLLNINEKSHLLLFALLILVCNLYYMMDLVDQYWHHFGIIKWI